MCHDITFLMICLIMPLSILVLTFAERDNKTKNILKTTNIYMNNTIAKNKKL